MILGIIKNHIFYRPSKEFCLLAENSDILIHEATFNDDLINLATRNMHSTI